jgi:hypothetical protein
MSYKKKEFPSEGEILPYDIIINAGSKRITSYVSSTTCGSVRVCLRGEESFYMRWFLCSSISTDMKKGCLITYIPMTLYYEFY